VRHVLQERPGETADEATVVFQYTVYDQLKPLVDEAGNKMRKVRVCVCVCVCVCWVEKVVSDAQGRTHNC
jgi:hypothetical protein